MASKPNDNPMLQGMSPDIRARFEVLQRSFVAALPGRWAEIEASLAPEAADLAALAGHLHRLAGAAGSYGLEALTQATRAAEAAAKRAPDGSDPELVSALALLGAELHAQVGEA